MRVFALVGNACCVPVEFLSDEQSAAFGQYSGELPQSEIERFFYLDGAARDLIGLRRGAHYQLGFALQLGTVRFLGTFLSDPLAVVAGVLDYMEAQLDGADPSVVARYVQRLPIVHEHAREIR